MKDDAGPRGNSDHLQVADARLSVWVNSVTAAATGAYTATESVEVVLVVAAATLLLIIWSVTTESGR